VLEVVDFLDVLEVLVFLVVLEVIDGLNKSVEISPGDLGIARGCFVDGLCVGFAVLLGYMFMPPSTCMTWPLT
jgi:hypothetical protein